jgi:hypothetical protein
MYLHIKKSVSKSFLLLLTASFFYFPLYASYIDIYDTNKPEFEYRIENGVYKVFTKEPEFIPYSRSEGWKLFLPGLIKSYDLSILRVNSIGHIDGFLSFSPKVYASQVIKPSTKLKYYISDYKTKNLRQLSYLLQGKAISYKKATSLVVEGHHIPRYISKDLHKTLYFKFAKTSGDNNALKKLIYSYSMTFDKKTIDQYVNTYLKVKPYTKNRKMDKIYTFMQNLPNLKSKTFTHQKIAKPKKTKKPAPIKKPAHKANYKLNKKLILFMKSYGYKNYETNSSQSINLDTVIYSINDLVKKIKKKQKFHEEELELLEKDLQGIVHQKLRYEKQNCKDLEPGVFDISCFEDKTYFNNYIYFTIQNDRLPPKELISAYGSSEVFNDVGVYYFINQNYALSEKYLLSSYMFADDKSIPAYNLGVLYASKTSKKSYKKAFEYFSKSRVIQAYYNTALLYYLGLGVKENDVQAYHYFKKAAVKGIFPAQKNADIMKKHKVGI